MSKKILTLIALGAALNATAQKDTLVGGQLDDVIVTTANKVEQKQSTTGKVITVIDKAQIEKSSAKTVSQLLNEQAGIVISGAYNNAGNVQTIYMRGANAGRTLILMDGIPMNDPSSITTDYDLNLFSINDVERIEICKGAQSTLYGSDAIAGVVNIITVKKDIDKAVNIKATTAFGNKNTTRNNVQLFGKLNKFTYTARFAQLKTDGFSSAYDSAGNKSFDNDGYKGNVISALVQYQATKQLSFKTFVQHSSYKADIDAAVFTDKSNYFIDNDVLNTGVGFNYKTNKLTVTGNYQYSHTHRYYDDGFSAGLANYSTNKYNGIGSFYELFASYKIDKQFTLLIGNDYRFATMNGAYFSSLWGASPYKDTSMNQYSVYASLMYHSLNNQLNVEIGGRINNHSRYGTNSTFTFNPSYTINKNWKAFASVSTGFKSPSIYQLYDTYSGNKDLKAEKSINYEAGIQFTDKKINTRIVYFNRKIDNGIDYNYISYQYFNYIKQMVNGIELELTVKPVKQLSITANYTLLSAKETTQNRLTNTDTVQYNYLLRRPKNIFNLNISWEPIKDFSISLNTKYVDNKYDVGGYLKKDVKLKSYVLLNAYVAYKLNSHIQFFADVQNIGNTKFFDIYGYSGIPTLANVGVTFNW
jgi:vitamin B12 transporter